MPARPLIIACLATCPLLLAACEQTPHADDEQSESSRSSSTTTGSPSMTQASLQDELDARKADFASRAPADKRALYARGIQAVRDDGIVEAAKNAGDQAPAFTLPDASGTPTTLASLLEDGPVVLVWYRGGWCPYCNMTLRAYQERLDEITKLGGTLVAISPELPDNTAKTVSENELDFVVLSDVGNAVAKDYGVVFTLIPEVHEAYQGFGVDEWNGQDTGELPLAATYVINKDAQITYAFLDADYTKRAEPQEVIDALADLQG